ncbi:hypothetical protein J3F83DRAFT_729234 [Trichoderma novae-zelandiae]
MLGTRCQQRARASIIHAIKAKSALRRALEEACAQEEGDWRASDCFARTCQEEPLLINVEESAILLYALIGAKSNPRFAGDELCFTAITRDTELSGSMYLLLSLIKLLQSPYGDGHDVSQLYPIIQERCERLKDHLMYHRGAPKFRLFLPSFVDEDGDGAGQQEEP